jgi:hypothetical protein
MFKTPVLFIVFNRPDTTEKVFEGIRSMKPAKLYVAADAPRKGNAKDEKNCKETRSIVEQVDWDCEVKKLYRDENLGCFKAVSGAIDWFFSHEEQGIILEDDCLPNEDFFSFCEEMLERFKDTPEVISINGSNLGYHLKNGNSYTFSRFMNMWGWATWRRSAQAIDYSLEAWEKKANKLLFLHNRLGNSLVDLDINWYKYWQHKFDYITQKEKITWDWQWNFHQIEHKQLSIVPGVNLVSNIGFSADATHTFKEDNHASNIPFEKLKYPLHHPADMKVDLEYEEDYVKWIWCYHKRISFLRYSVEFIREKVSQ